jgi:hypothetical protein
MNKIKIIKKVKANYIRFKLHRVFGFAANLFVYFGYLNKMSSWIEANKSVLEYNDFYNKAVLHKNRFKMYAWYLDKRSLRSKDINYLEFGVGRGNSLRWWSENNENLSSRLWAFDTYEGLPEDYGHYKAGTFNRGGNFPLIEDDRINFVKGLFQDTLLQTIPEIAFKDKTTIVHVDGDLYSSAMYCLSVLFPHLKNGDIIIFDEFVVPAHEYKAFEDFVSSFYIKLKPIGAINNYLQFIFEVE